MAPRTPYLATDEALPPLASRYVAVGALPWLLASISAPSE